MKKEIILIGGGGHCKACIDVIEKEDKFRISGIVDIKEKVGQKVLGYRIIACDKDLPGLTKRYKYFLITIGQIKTASRRIDKFSVLKKLGAKFPVVISPLAYVSKHAFIGEGTIVMHKAFINADVDIGKNCIINTNAVIEHGSIIRDHCHISTGCILNGECIVEKRVFIGSNSIISNNIKIAEDVVIGAGSCVISPIAKKGIYGGNPARKLD